jgi:hypothetical protein
MDHNLIHASPALDEAHRPKYLPNIEQVSRFSYIFLIPHNNKHEQKIAVICTSLNNIYHISQSIP